MISDVMAKLIGSARTSLDNAVAGLHRKDHNAAEDYLRIAQQTIQSIRDELRYRPTKAA